MAQTAMPVDFALIEANLRMVLGELRDQTDIGRHFPSEQRSFSDQMAQIQEWILDHGEYGLAYESLVAMLEGFPFRLSGPAAVKLLEVGLLFQFKTDRPQDIHLDHRSAER